MLKAENKEYTFDGFLKVRDMLNDFDNPFLQEVFKATLEDEWPAFQEKVEPFAGKLSTKWRKWTNEIARPENLPRLRHYDAYNRRIDRVVRPLEAVQLTEEVFAEAVFSDEQLSFEGIIKRYFLHGNGEAGITCPLACTDGLIALIEAHYDEVPEEVKRIHRHAKEGINGDFAVGAQYMSEIQGGSNIPANILKAVPHGDYYKLYGNKFFCSAVHADYSVVTARVEDTSNVAVFIVPSWLPGNKEKEIRNGFRINRLKWKLGTSELPSGEIDYDGAVAYRIGAEDRGVALAVSIVLTRSRLDIGFASAAFLMRAAREAKLYARFRFVFDRTIDGFPMVAAQLDDLEDAAKRMAATAFEIYKRFTDQKDSTPLENLALRELILLQKIYSAKETVEKLRLAISIFGGHGAIEEFSSIPRLFRDSIVNELWEGPRNVLLSQVYRDLMKAQKEVPLSTILTEMFPHLTDQERIEYTEKVACIMEAGLVSNPNDMNKKAARQWESLWEELFISYQEAVVKQFDGYSILPENVYNRF